MGHLATLLRAHVEVAIFLTLAAGFVIGRVRIGTVHIGGVLGTLLAGLAIGQLSIQVPPIVKTIFFDLFLFATGYKVGPQFVRGLGTSALPQVILSFVVCLTALLVTVLTSKIAGYDSGTAAGLMAGTFSTSTIIGTASDAISRLGMPQPEGAQLINNVATAYTVCFLIGAAVTVWLLSSLAPRLLRIDLEAESQKLERPGMSASEDDGAQSAYREWDVRAYLLDLAYAGRSVADLEVSFQPERVFVQRVRRGRELLDAQPALVLAPGDTVALRARRRVVSGGVPIGAEVEDRGLLEFPLETRHVVVTNSAVVNRSVESLARDYGRGVTLLELVRGGEQIPFVAATTLNRGDQLLITGTTDDVERVGRLLGYLERSNGASDVVFIAAGIVLGVLIGVMAIVVRGIPITLSASGGVLVAGLFLGWLRSRRPTFGWIPAPALWMLETVGLAVFIGVVGLDAGPGFLVALKRIGLTLPLASTIVVVTPYVVAL